MKSIITMTAMFFAMLSVAAAADLPIGKYPVGTAARPAPARPGALGPGERGAGRVAPEGAFGGGATGGWLLSKPNGPSPKEQEQTLLLELHTGKNAKQAAVAFLSTIYSHQQADNLALQSAASNLLPMREALGSESRDTAPCIEGLGQTGGRDVISYLVNPFRDQIARAFHEE
jgi:hypothetical protein